MPSFKLTLVRQRANLIIAGLIMGAAIIMPSDQALAAPKVLFEDDFNGPGGTAPDPTKWVNYGSWCKTPAGITVDQPGFGYISCSAQKYLDGQGNLVLPATPTKGSGVQTATKFGFVYGEASAWMKMPKEPGYWPAFWTLNNLNQRYKTPPEQAVTGEADIVEFYSTWNKSYHAVTHAHGAPPKTAEKPNMGDISCRFGIDLTEDFHKYTARFEPGKVTYMMDGKVCATAYADKFIAWPFGPNNLTENWLILDNAIGGAGGAQTPATKNSEVLVSRVEVLALDATPTPVPSSTSIPTLTPKATVTPTPVSPDLNGDGKVTVLDLSIFLNGWGKPGQTDLNGDGTTDGTDLSRLLTAWMLS